MKRKFGHCVSNWTIENSHMLPMNFPFQILSPEFEVRGFKATKWVMKIENKEIDGEFILHFQLDNLDSDEKKLHFLAQCNLEISSKIINKIYFYENFTCEFNSNERGLNRPIKPNHSFDILLLYNLHIECKLLMFFGVEEDVETCREVGLRELSQDLLKLYESERYSDVILKVNDTHSVHHINAHKPILHARNTLLRNILFSNTEKVTVDYSGRIDEWRNIVKFLYTADMKHVLDPPCISYYDISVAYNIEPIISFYQPDELNFNSTVPVEQFSVTCTIPEFLTSNEICIETPQLITQNTNCKMIVYPRSFKNKSDTCIFIEVDGHIHETVLVEVYASNAQNKNLLYRIFEKMAGNIIYEKRIFLEREILKHFLEDGNLTLTFKLLIVNLNLLNDCKRYSVTKIKCKPYSAEKNFCTLSRDMMKLYYDTIYPKYGFVIGDETYFVHKCILFVRAKFLLDKIPRDMVVKNERARHWVMIHLIYFLYTGKYNSPFQLKDVLALYDLADSFNIETLKCTLEHKIKVNLHTFRTEDLLKVFYFIDSQNMPNLKHYARIVLDPSTLKKFIE